MSVIAAVDGRNVINNLFLAYQWFDVSRRDASPMTTYPPANALLRYSLYPPDDIFEQSSQRIRNFFNNARESLLNADIGFRTYNLQGALLAASYYGAETIGDIVSIIVGDNGNSFAGRLFGLSDTDSENADETEFGNGSNIDTAA